MSLTQTALHESSRFQHPQGKVVWSGGIELSGAVGRTWLPPESFSVGLFLEAADLLTVGGPVTEGWQQDQTEGDPVFSKTYTRLFRGRLCGWDWDQVSPGADDGFYRDMALCGHAGSPGHRKLGWTRHHLRCWD